MFYCFRCSSTQESTGLQVYREDIFVHCDHQLVVERSRHSAAFAVIGIVICSVTLAASFFVIMKCRDEMKKDNNKLITKKDYPLMIYRQMKDLSSFSVTEDEEI